MTAAAVPYPGSAIGLDARLGLRAAARYPRAMSVTEESDETLMARAGTGDQRAYAALVERHLPRTYALARRVLAGGADAEDVAQEAFLRVWTQAPSWSPDGARFTTWLYRVTMNLCIDRRRKVVPLPLETAGDPIDPEPGAFRARHRSEMTEAVEAALAELPETQRAALVLTYYEELSNPETAAVLGTTVGAVESLLVRARRTLKARLGSFMEDTLETRDDG